ncbi:MAG: hypothetical protein LAP40_16870 [Acidobacteriia bacterium]|nr:hypothetical protein [Terriglobia bacterium]
MTATETPQLSPAEAKAMIQGFANHEKFVSHLQIRNKDGVPVQYGMSPMGRKINRSIRKQEAQSLPVRQVVLKPSQVWASSSVATEIFRRVPFFPGRRALVLADTAQHAGLVFEYYQQYIRSYADNPYGSEWNAAIELPELLKDTEQHLRWANDSSILVGTANNVEIGRSAPYNWVQLSEAAFYRDMGTLMTGLMQRVPNSPDSGVIVESTANGMGGDFYDLCQLAMNPRRAGGWAFVFFAWWEHPEYRLKPEPGFKLTRDELAELQKYNLTVDQIAWRRRQIEVACEGKIDRFRQEFPGNPEEAFQSSGRPIFDMGAVARLPITLEAPRGRLEVVEVGLEKRPQFIQAENNKGELVIYKQPQKRGRYIIGADHAEGIDPTARLGTSDPDYCSATVFDVDTGEEIAKLKERYEAFPWATRLYWLGRFYNWAFQVPEQKAQGKAVIGHLLAIEGGYPLELIYSKERDPSDRRTPLLQELGYDTNAVFRPYLISTLDQALREGSIKIHDPETIAQLRQFVRKASGREEGIGHDDDVFGVALAVIGIPNALRAFKYRESLDRLAASLRPHKYRKSSRDEEDD